MLEAFKHASWNLFKTLWAACALWDVMSLATGVLGKVVLFMNPVSSTWCYGPGFVQAEFRGYKIKSWAPVKYSESGIAEIAGLHIDVPFSFVNDTTPGSPKPTGGGRSVFGEGILGLFPKLSK